MNSEEKKYINPYIGGILLGIVLFLAYFLTGSGLGASGSISRIQTSILELIATTHVNTTAYFAQLGGGEKLAIDSPWVFMFLGVILGGLTSGYVNNRLKFETRKGPGITVRQRWLFAFIGGTIMGYGARLARGCTSGQALSGGAVLSVGSWVFMLAVFAGGYALAYFVRKLWT